MLRSGAELQVVAGPVIGGRLSSVIGPASDIRVPEGLFKIVTTGVAPVAFLFWHVAEGEVPGCDMDGELDDCVVRVNLVEDATGLDFFPALNDGQEEGAEASRNLAASGGGTRGGGTGGARGQTKGRRRKRAHIVPGSETARDRARPAGSCGVPVHVRPRRRRCRVRVNANDGGR